MRQMNPSSHASYLRDELMKFFPPNTVTSRLRKTIGRELGGMLDNEDDDELSFAWFFPVRALFDWLMSGQSMEAADLTDESGVLYDDEGEVITNCLSLQFSHAQHIAAFGLWLIDSDAPALGGASFDDNGRNDQGWLELDVQNHKAECLLNAYQALCYATRLTQAVELSTEEKERIGKIDFSALGVAGAAKRHTPIRALRNYAVSLYEPSEWKSANEAAHQLMGNIMAHGRSINAMLVPSNAQRTIAEWFRKKSV